MQYRKASILLSSITGLVISMASLNAYSGTDVIDSAPVNNESHVSAAGHQPHWVMLASSSATSRSGSPSHGSTSGKSSGSTSKGSNDNRNGRF
ncbi:hypothetical protein ACLED0_01375 [Lonsdalea quercina]|uniref:Uncharacterized protein n=2 Tax=Lonsdalea quercina TaxID=71657 RepID=A0A1H3W529_9GAMM|nr:hypothetical protein SAMN02982996_00341 [Lonsdalea quercina]